MNVSRMSQLCHNMDKPNAIPLIFFPVYGYNEASLLGAIRVETQSQKQHSIIRVLTIVQWVLPIILFFLATVFEITEHVIKEHEIFSPALWSETALFGIIGPVAVWLVLRWVRENQKQLEVANFKIYKMNAELELRVAERTVELEEKNIALKEANEELRALDDLKSDFVSLVSHELRTPLTNINGGIELIARHKEKLPERKQAVLDILRNESLRLTHLVQNILDVSLLETGKLKAVPGPIALQPFLNTLLSSRIHTQQNHTIVINIPPDLPEAWADETHMGDIIINLVDNAIKYSPEGGEISVSAYRENDSIIIAVKDNGIGIPPYAQRHLFKQFYRANNNNDREVYGHGLGLYFCRKLILAQKGEIWVESTGVPGEGSTFFVSIPVIYELEDENILDTVN